MSKKSEITAALANPFFRDFASKHANITEAELSNMSKDDLYRLVVEYKILTNPIVNDGNLNV